MVLSTINGKNLWKNPGRKDPKNTKRKTSKRKTEIDPLEAIPTKPTKPNTKKKYSISTFNKSP